MTETYAHLSNNAVYSATIVFTLAMLAHVVEWAMARQLVAVPTQAERRALVSAGDQAVPRRRPVGRLPAGAIAVEIDEDDLERSDRYGRIGFGLTCLGFLVLASGCAVSRDRGAPGAVGKHVRVLDHRVPGGVRGVPRARAASTTSAGSGCSSPASSSWCSASPSWSSTGRVSPLVPALHSYWLMIHVSSAAIAGGAFTVGALASVLYLLRRRLEVKAADHPELPRTGFLWRTPNAESIDRIAYRVHAFAFPLWTFAVMCGAIWAQYAWGRFWGWDPKEVWAFITWVVYAAYLHARATAGWQGRAAAYVALLGYATFLFNFVGINLFGSGLHSYAGM